MPSDAQMKRTMWRTAAKIAGVAMVVAIAASPLGPPPDPRPLTIEASGCAAVLEDGTCERPLGAIRIWIDAETPDVVRLDDENVAGFAAVRIAGGTRVSLDPGTATRLEIVAGGRRGILRLVPPVVPSWAEAAGAAKARGDHAAVL